MEGQHPAEFSSNFNWSHPNQLIKKLPAKCVGAIWSLTLHDVGNPGWLDTPHVEIKEKPHQASSAFNEMACLTVQWAIMQRPSLRRNGRFIF